MSSPLSLQCYFPLFNKFASELLVLVINGDFISQLDLTTNPTSLNNSHFRSYTCPYSLANLTILNYGKTQNPFSS